METFVRQCTQSTISLSASHSGAFIIRFLTSIWSFLNLLFARSAGISCTFFCYIFHTKTKAKK